MPDISYSDPQEIAVIVKAEEERKRQQEAQRQVELQGQREQLQRQLGIDRQRALESQARVEKLQKEAPPYTGIEVADSFIPSQEYQDWSMQLKSAKEAEYAAGQQYGATGQALQYLGEIPTKTAAQEREIQAKAKESLAQAQQARVEAKAAGKPVPTIKAQLAKQAIEQAERAGASRELTPQERQIAIEEQQQGLGIKESAAVAVLEKSQREVYKTLRENRLSHDNALKLAIDANVLNDAEMAMFKRTLSGGPPVGIKEKDWVEQALKGATEYIDVGGVKVSRADARALADLTGEKQYNEAVSLGIIPKDSKYVEGVGGEWSYIANWSETQQKQKEYKEAKQTQKDFEALNTKLKDGWISNADLKVTKEKDPAIYNILMTDGIDAANKEINRINEEVNRYNQAIIDKRLDYDRQVQDELRALSASLKDNTIDPDKIKGSINMLAPSLPVTTGGGTPTMDYFYLKTEKPSDVMALAPYAGAILRVYEKNRPKTYEEMINTPYPVGFTSDTVTATRGTGIDLVGGIPSKAEEREAWRQTGEGVKEFGKSLVPGWQTKELSQTEEWKTMPTYVQASLIAGDVGMALLYALGGLGLVRAVMNNLGRTAPIARNIKTGARLRLAEGPGADTRAITKEEAESIVRQNQKRLEQIEKGIAQQKEQISKMSAGRRGDTGISSTGTEGEILTQIEKVKELPKQPPRTATISPEEANMSEAQFERFIKYRGGNDPLVTPQEFKKLEFDNLVKDASKASGKSPVKVKKLYTLDEMEDLAARQRASEIKELISEGEKMQKRQVEAQELADFERYVATKQDELGGYFREAKRYQSELDKALEVLAKAEARDAEIKNLIALSNKRLADMRAGYKLPMAAQRIGELQNKIDSVDLSPQQASNRAPLNRQQLQNITKVTGLTEAQIKQLQRAGILSEFLTSTKAKLGEALREQTDTSLKQREITKQETKEQLKQQEKPQLQQQTELKQALQTKTQLKQQPKTKQQQKTETRLQQQTKTQTKTQLQQQTRTQLQQQTKTQLQQRIEEGLKTKQPTKPQKPTKPGKPPKLKLPKGKPTEEEWTPEEIKSAIAWKAGIVVHALKYPYRRGIDEQSFSLNKVPAGLKVLDIKGKGSAQRSARAIGRIPSRLTVDVGFEDVVITKGRGNRVYLRHARDTRDTTSQLTIKRNISKKKGRVYHTKTAGGDIISRRPLGGY